MVAAHRQVGVLIDRQLDTYRRLVATWEHSRLPRNATVDGREFIHVFDDVKDHFADRRADMSYLIAPFESIGLDEWRNGLKTIIDAYSQQTGRKVKELDEELMDD